MWELDCEESWAPKNWCFWTVVLEKTLESPLDCKEIQPVHSEDQPWDFFGRNDATAETPVLWPPHAKSWLIGKDSDAGRDWGQEEKGMTEDEMAGWHHWFDGRESEWTPGVRDGQGGLACCDSWGRKKLDTTERLNWTELKLNIPPCLLTEIGSRQNRSNARDRSSKVPVWVMHLEVIAAWLRGKRNRWLYTDLRESGSGHKSGKSIEKRWPVALIAISQGGSSSTEQKMYPSLWPVRS